MALKIDVKNKEQVIKWLEKIKKGSGDARPLWKAMTPKIIYFIDWQFREEDDTGKRWKSLKPAYKEWKIKKGFASGIGVMTGKLKKGAGELAIKKYKRKVLQWSVDQSFVRGKKGVRYAKYFDGVRPVYKNVVLRINSFLTFDIKRFESGSLNSFTYAWLRKYLEP